DVLIEGHGDDVAAQSARLDGFEEVAEPPVPDELLEAAVPPALVETVLDHDQPARAQLGVGLVMFSGHPDAVDLRARSEAEGGRLHTLRPIEGFDPFGSPPRGLEIMRRLKEAFDPAGILNPGRLTFL